MELLKEVKQGIEMMSYLLTHPEEFDGIHIPFVICLMQFTGGLFAEMTNMFNIATRTKSEDAITFFVAFHVLHGIDNIYVEAFSEFELMECCDEPLVFKVKIKDVKWRERSIWNKIYFTIYSAIKFFHNTCYFYFSPYLVNFIPYFCPGKPLITSTGH
jgi:hypothetical protein